jgi:hypothetical protein
MQNMSAQKIETKTEFFAEYLFFACDVYLLTATNNSPT